jgi:hypothetical protein
MLRLTIAAALSLAAAHLAVAAPAKHSGDADGERFEYSSELRNDGVIRINGVMLGSLQPFRLDVLRSGQVHGRFGMWPVDYKVSKAARDSMAAQLGEKGLTVADAAPPAVN